jgi:hypothetical protein
MTYHGNLAIHSWLDHPPLYILSLHRHQVNQVASDLRAWPMPTRGALRRVGPAWTPTLGQLPCFCRLSNKNVEMPKDRNATCKANRTLRDKSPAIIPWPQQSHLVAANLVNFVRFTFPVGYLINVANHSLVRSGPHSFSFVERIHRGCGVRTNRGPICVHVVVIF